MKIVCLFHSLLKEIQQWMPLIRLIRPRSSYLQIELAFCASKLGKGPQLVRTGYSRMPRALLRFLQHSVEAI
jgi:hypothetical protein